MKVDKKILICYNSPFALFPIYNGKPSEQGGSVEDLSETSFLKEIKKIRKGLQLYFSDVKTLAVNHNIKSFVEKIAKFSPDAIFNCVESVEGIAAFEAYIAGIYELLNIHYTGSIPSTLSNCLNKERTKLILKANNIATPASISVKINSNLQPETFQLRFPVIVKLLNEDASIGISEFSVVHKFSELKKRIQFLFKTYKQDLIIEEYIEGRELNVAILGDKVLPISEIDFDGLPDNLPKIVTYEGKWMAESVYYKHTKPKCPTLLNSKTKKKVEKIALDAFNALNCRDYARVDIRLDKNENPYVIEINPNPDISTDSGFARAANAAGLSYPELIKTIVSFPLERKKYDTQAQAS